MGVIPYSMGQLEDAWTAGVIDSDGCITIKCRRVKEKVYYALFVVVGQSGETRPKVISRLHQLYGGNTSKPTKDKRSNRLPRWEWQITCNQAEQFLRRVLPYLVEKKDQAELALEYRERALGRGKGDLAHTYYARLRATKNYKQTHPKWGRSRERASARSRQARTREKARGETQSVCDP